MLHVGASPVYKRQEEIALSIFTLNANKQVAPNARLPRPVCVQLSIGDIAVVARLTWLAHGSLDGIPTTILDDYPLLSALVERVNAEPKIAAYVQEQAANKSK